MSKQNRVLIIGGGAAGLISAITAARNGAEVKIIEQMPRVGKKLLATGNGRCNITNSCIQLDRYHGECVEFAEYALSTFDVKRTTAFFEGIGLSVKEEDEGKIYPYSGQASSVLDILRYEASRLGVVELCDAEVKQIIATKNEFTLILRDGSKVVGDRVIVAAGGRANSNLGSTGTAYKLVSNLGHSITDTFPALVQLKLNSHHLKALAGVKFIGSATVLANDKVVKQEKGEILFADYGISGPPILQLSRVVAEKITVGNSIKIQLDLFPEFTIEEVTKILNSKLALDKNKPIDFWLVGFINKKLIPIVLKAAGISDIHKSCMDMEQYEVENIVRLLKSWEFEATGTQPWRDAQVTAGGVSVKDINPETMESKIVKGLYLCGEILDIDGDCGGFNLQWAWSSGYLAGMNASK